MMLLGLILTARCNARCGHCSTSCGPERTESLSRDQIFRLMDEADELAGDQVLQFMLTGGEPFLDFELLLAIVARSKELDAEVTCVTNGYWATSPAKARTLLATLKDAGLTSLAVSTSRFHQQFIKRERVERVLRASRDLGLPCGLKYAHVRSELASLDAVRSWAQAAGAIEVQELPLMPKVREGEHMPDSDFMRTPGLPEGCCPTALISIREDGEAYTCCTPGGFVPLLSLGHTRDRDLRAIQDRLYLGGTQQILRKHGPLHFARAIRARGLGGRLRESYTNVCELCTHIAGDPMMAAVAAEESAAFEMRQLESILSAVVEKPKREKPQWL